MVYIIYIMFYFKDGTILNELYYLVQTQNKTSLSEMDQYSGDVCIICLM